MEASAEGMLPLGGMLSELGGAMGNGEGFSLEAGAEWKRKSWEGRVVSIALVSMAGG